MHRRGHGRGGHGRRRGRPARHHRRPAGDRPRLQDADRPRRRDRRRGPTYPGAVPTFSAYQADVVQIEMDADGMRVDLLEETLDRSSARAARRSSSTPCRRSRTRRASRCRSSAAAGSSGSPPSASCSCSRTTRTGCSATRAIPLPPLYALDGGEYVIYLGTFSKILSPGLRLGWTAAPRPCSRSSTSASRAPTCARRRSASTSSSSTSRSATGATCSARCASSIGAAATRCSTRSPSTFRGGGLDAPAGGLFIWATLPDYIDTTDLLARALREHVAFVPVARRTSTAAAARRCG